MRVYPVAGKAEPDGARNIQVKAGPKSEEQLGVILVGAGYGQLQRSKQRCQCWREGNVCPFMHSAKAGANQERNFLPFANVKLRTRRKSVGQRIKWHVDR